MAESNKSTDPVDPKCWVLARTEVNSKQAESITRLIQAAKHAHYVDVLVRINGQERFFQGDWIKHLEPQP